MPECSDWTPEEIAVLQREMARGDEDDERWERAAVVARRRHYDRIHALSTHPHDCDCEICLPPDSPEEAA